MRDFTDLNEIKKPANQIKKQRTNTRQLWWLKQKWCASTSASATTRYIFARMKNRLYRGNL